MEQAQRRGHHLTLFTRGLTNPDLFPDVERITGDRDVEGGLDALAGRDWDAAIDTSGRRPLKVGAAATALSQSVDRYVFVSSLSVYPDGIRPGADEGTPVQQLLDPAMIDSTDMVHYGALKAMSEAAAELAMPGRVLVVRPGLIVGRYDPTDRYGYWPQRLAAGGRVLAPGRPERVVQVVDARDLAAWTLDMFEQGATGVFNAVGPALPLTMAEALAATRSGVRSDAELAWIDDDFLLQHGVQPWTQLGLWIPEVDDPSSGFMSVDCGRAIAAGLHFRPLDETARDALEWERERPPGPRRWLSRERETELLAEWDRR